MNMLAKTYIVLTVMLSATGALIVDSHPRFSKILRILGFLVPGLFFLAGVVELLWFQPYFILLSMIAAVGLTLHTEGYYRVIYGKVMYQQLVTDVMLSLVILLFSSETLIEVITLWIVLELVSVLLILMERGYENYPVAIKYLVFCATPGDVSILSIWVLASQKYGFIESLLIPLTELSQTSMSVGLLESVILVIGFLTKLGQFPLHSWLPTAYYHAPSPGTAVMSGLLSKMGAFSLFVVISMFSLDPAVFYIMMAQGIVTSLYGYLMTTVQTDVKKVIVYSSLGHMGVVTMLFALYGLVRQPIIQTLIVVYVVYHGIAKALGFINISIMEQLANTHELYKLGYLGLVSPNVLNIAFLTFLNLTGFPPTPGFIVKFLLIFTTLSLVLTGSLLALPVLAIVSFSTVLTVIYMSKFIAAYTSSIKPPLKIPPKNLNEPELIGDYFLSFFTIILSYLLLYVFPADFWVYILLFLTALTTPLAILISVRNLKEAKEEKEQWLSGVEA